MKTAEFPVSSVENSLGDMEGNTKSINSVVNVHIQQQQRQPKPRCCCACCNIFLWYLWIFAVRLVISFIFIVWYGGPTLLLYYYSQSAAGGSCISKVDAFSLIVFGPLFHGTYLLQLSHGNWHATNWGFWYFVGWVLPYTRLWELKGRQGRAPRFVLAMQKGTPDVANTCCTCLQPCCPLFCRLFEIFFHDRNQSHSDSENDNNCFEIALETEGLIEREEGSLATDSDSDDVDLLEMHSTTAYVNFIFKTQIKKTWDGKEHWYSANKFVTYPYILAGLLIWMVVPLATTTRTKISVDPNRTRASMLIDLGVMQNAKGTDCYSDPFRWVVLCINLIMGVAIIIPHGWLWWGIDQFYRWHQKTTHELTKHIVITSPGTMDLWVDKYVELKNLLFRVKKKSFWMVSFITGLSLVIGVTINMLTLSYQSIDSAFRSEFWWCSVIMFIFTCRESIMLNSSISKATDELDYVVKKFQYRIIELQRLPQYQAEPINDERSSKLNSNNNGFRTSRGLSQTLSFRSSRSSSGLSLISPRSSSNVGLSSSNIDNVNTSARRLPSSNSRNSVFSISSVDKMDCEKTVDLRKMHRIGQILLNKDKTNRAQFFLVLVFTAQISLMLINVMTLLFKLKV
jgi:hypothetical protein